jgi:hypothetical protein
MLEVGMRVRNVRRLDVIGVVVSLDAPNNQWCTRSDDFRVIVKYPRLTRLSNGKWKGGELDELPVDLLRTGEKVPDAFASHKRSGDEGGIAARMTAYDKRKRRK